MYKFIIKDITGNTIYTSLCTRKSVSEAQQCGLEFIRVRSIMESEYRLPIGSNVDVIGVVN